LVGLVVAIRNGTQGLAIVGLALSVVAGVALLRAVRVVVRLGSADPATVLQTFVVVCVYDLARALALMARASHPARRRPAPVVAL